MENLSMAASSSEKASWAVEFGDWDPGGPGNVVIAISELILIF